MTPSTDARHADALRRRSRPRRATDDDGRRGDRPASTTTSTATTTTGTTTDRDDDHSGHGAVATTTPTAGTTTAGPAAVTTTSGDDWRLTRDTRRTSSDDRLASRSASGSPRPSALLVLAGLDRGRRRRLHHRVAAARRADRRRGRPGVRRVRRVRSGATEAATVRERRGAAPGVPAAATCRTTTSCWSPGGTTASARPVAAWRRAHQSDRAPRDVVAPARSTTTARTTRRQPEPASSLVDVQTVQQGDEHRRPGRRDLPATARGGLHDTMRTYAIVAALVAAAGHRGGAAGQSGRLLAPLRTLRETADDITETDLSQRLPVTGNDDITALTRTFNGMLDRLEAAFVGQRAVPRRRRPRAEDPAHRAARPPRAARRRQPRGGRRDPRAAARRGRPDVAAGRRPDPARQERPPRLPAARDGRPRPASPSTWSPRPAASATATGPSTRPPSVTVARRRAAAHPGGAPARRQRRQAHRARRRDRDRLVVRRRRRPGSGSATPGRASPPEDREQIFERFGRSAVPPGDEGFGLGLSIVGAIARAHGGTRATVEDAGAAAAARFVIDPACGSGEEAQWPAS